MAGRDSLLTTGITPVPDWVAREMQRPMIDGHGLEAAGLVANVRKGMAAVMGTAGEVFLFPGTGTGGLEASIVNHLSPGDRVLACTNGFFSELYADIAEKLGADVQKLAFEWGKGIDWSRVADVLKQDRSQNIKAILLTHHETSTGVLTQLDGLREAKGSHPALAMLNALSSAGGTELQTDFWGVDVIVTCSHKGLMCPPGITFVSANERAKERQACAKMPKAYWDIGNQRHWLSRGVTPFDPPLSLLYGIDKVLECLQNRTEAQEIYRRVASNATLFRDCLDEMPVEIVADVHCRAPHCTVLRFPEYIVPVEVKGLLKSGFGILVSSGMGRLSSATLRVNHQGWVFPRDMFALLFALRAFFEVAPAGSACDGAEIASSSKAFGG
ncbi:MAG: pyridoxal-phosphate-dependent aminotransferase family protein [Burkholderiales bacterium]